MVLVVVEAIPLHRLVGAADAAEVVEERGDAAIRIGPLRSALFEKSLREPDAVLDVRRTVKHLVPPAIKIHKRFLRSYGAAN